MNIEALIGGLNPEQEKAVRTTRGPLLILAGAGSGKTRVITVRIAAMVRMGILPGHILAVTFTNKASREMAERLGGILSPEVASGVTVSTFHKLGVMILREYGHHVGLKGQFTIVDTDDQLGIIRESMRAENVSLERYEPRWVLGQISNVKNGGFKPGERDLRLTDVVGNLIERVYKRYDATLKEIGAVDFDDLLLRPLELLRGFPTVLSELRDRFRYIHVDEFQDTNGVQMELLRLLAKEHRNLCVVGDDDQSIYGWRGARIENVLGFDREFPECTVIKLTQNYRSTGAILEAANAVIRNNSTRMEKELWTATGYGEPIQYRRVETPEDEADHIVAELLRLKMNQRFSSSAIGILFRANSQARVIEQALRVASIPYRVVGGMTFFDRKEVKDTLSYLRFIVNPQDELALRRVLAFPQRGVGEGTIVRLISHAKSKGCTAGELIKKGDLPSGIHRRAEQAFMALKSVLALREEAEGGNDPVGALAQALSLVKFRAGLWEASKTREEGEKRWDNVEEVLTAFKRFVDKRQGTVTASDFLQDLALSQQDDKEKENDTPVILMSLHASKGLEFPIVFLPGIEESLLPHWRSIESGDVAEERRLFYVGITRAKQELYLSGCRIRRQYKKTSQCKASRFLDELPSGITEAGIQAENWSEEDAHKAAMDQLAHLFGDDG